MIQVQVLHLEGCPNTARALELVREVASELGVETRIDVVEVADPEAATGKRFLGSPTIRVDGRDVEPGAETRVDFALACRTYGSTGTPRREWIAAALRAAA